MKSLKYITLIGLLCAGLTSLARADINPLGIETQQNSPTVELATFKSLGGDPDAFVCGKFEVGTGFDPEFTFPGTFSVVDNGDGTIDINFSMNPGFEICGLAVKDGLDETAFFSVTNGQGAGTGTLADIPVPGNGDLSHVTVFCCGVGVPDGGTTVMLLGAALSTLGVARRFFLRR
jgi:VPDSG-CTERM motif